MPSKRKQRSDSGATETSIKKQKVQSENVGTSAGVQVYELPGKIATAEAAAAVDSHPPFTRLIEEMGEQKDVKGECAVYWMRMQDMRIQDNRALAMASRHAKKNSVPLVVLFVFSPGDYKAHERSPRRIDFTLRNLECITEELSALDIPVHTVTYTPRKTVPEKVVRLLQDWKAGMVFANIEHEVDELRRDLQVTELCNGAGMSAIFCQDRCLINPGDVTTQQGKVYTVYTPWLKSWSQVVNRRPKCLEASPMPQPNDPKVHGHALYGSLFDTMIPELIEGFECHDKEKMAELWPAGNKAASDILDRFLQTKARKSQIGDTSPLADGAEESHKHNRAQEYAEDRNRTDIDSSSRISPYLAAGVISTRECIRRMMMLQGNSKFMNPDRTNGPGMWLSEVAWREFYTHIMACFPRTSMGRPFLEKYHDVQWETDEVAYNAWREGKTGFPIVDAAMRQCNTQGWMHNRSRMIAAMFLTKDLMIDWRLGERHFMENLIDGDLASNNGGWQWSASTGVDPQPYFRIFNPLLQSEKADPTGDYIRHFVPELRELSGKALHDPFQNLPKARFKKLGYPEPIVDHAAVKDRVVRRYKNPGSK